LVRTNSRDSITPHVARRASGEFARQDGAIAHSTLRVCFTRSRLSPFTPTHSVR
jgi:hypothetical protein